jgi:hypothetical protein
MGEVHERIVDDLCAGHARAHGVLPFAPRRLRCRLTVLEPRGWPKTATAPWNRPLFANFHGRRAA